MSEYYTVEGQVTYKDKKAYDAAVARLRAGHWLDEKGVMGDEACSEQADGVRCINNKARTITIPHSVYWNLGRALHELFRGAAKGALAWSCTDGAEDLGVLWVNEAGGIEDESAGLAQWARRNGLSMKGSRVPQGDDEDHRQWDRHNDWMNEVEYHFFDVPWPKLTPKEIACRFASK